MELGIRLSAVAGMVQKANMDSSVGCLADIGCDHGLISIALVQNGMADRMIACDINKGPLAHAARNIEAAGLSDKIELRLGDGFAPVKKGECSGAVIAGLGGPLGLRILYDGREVIRDYRQIVFQVQSKLALVRHLLSRWGFKTEEELMVSEDGKFYPIMRLLPPHKSDFYETEIPDFDAFLDTEEAELLRGNSDYICSCTYGQQLLEAKSPALLIFLGREEERLLGIVEKLEKSGEDNKERLAEIFEEIDTLMLAKWKLQGQ